MSFYTALARKWRPRSFAEMTGQEHVLRALTNALSSQRVHHAYLFAGTRGVGKTTVARILAKCLNCECGVSATPCGECASCREIDAGRSVDVIEVDAASRTKVDDTRDLLDNVQYAPTRSRYKIYLIDEVHMLSLSSFNALLKTLEEPPPHVKFLLATTDPRKLPVTVLSRCLQFNLKRLPVALIAARLQHVLQAENVPFEPAAVQLLAQAGDGSLRDALSLLDQLLAYGDGKALEAEARAMLGTVGRDEVVQLARLLAAADAPALLALAQALDERASDHEQLLGQLAALLERVALRQIVPDYQGDELHPVEVLAELGRAIEPEDVQLYYQTAIMGKRDLAHAPDAYTGFRMTLLRMLAFRPGAAAAVAGPRAAGGSLPATAPTASAQNVSAGTASAQSPAPRMAQLQPAAVAAVAPGAPSPRPPDRTAAASDWPAILAALDLVGAPRQLAANCVLLGREGASVRLALDPRSAPWRTRAQEEKLAQALSRYYGSPVRVEIEVRESQEDTPAQSVERAQAERREQARMDFDADPTVEAFKQRFGASVIADTVRPSDPEP